MNGWRTDRSPEFADDPDAQVTAQLVMSRLAGEMSSAGDLAESLMKALGSHQALLPIGAVTAPFWINVDTSQIICAVRVTETARDTGKPSYTGLVFRLDDAELAAMVEAVGLLRLTRLTVRRFGDMLPYDEQRRPDRGLVATSSACDMATS